MEYGDKKKLSVESDCRIVYGWLKKGQITRVYILSKHVFNNTKPKTFKQNLQHA